MNAVADNNPNYFGLFDLPESYRIERPLLDERYRELQRMVHPDRFASASDQERRLSMQQAADINEAYNTLKDPLSRARYLLELRGRSFGDTNRTTKDVDFLMEQMELREALDGVSKWPEPLVALDDLSARVNEDMSNLEAELAAALDDTGDDEVALGAALKLQFFVRLQDEIAEMEADFEDANY
jgi:molecular chaperone HscB